MRQAVHRNIHPRQGARSRDLLVEETIKIDQQLLGAGTARRDAIVDVV